MSAAKSTSRADSRYIFMLLYQVGNEAFCRVSLNRMWADDLDRRTENTDLSKNGSIALMVPTFIDLLISRLSRS